MTVNNGETTRLRDAIAAFIRRVEGRRDMYWRNAIEHSKAGNLEACEGASIRYQAANVILNDAAELRQLVFGIREP